ncbi:MAG: permease [Candidatus Heteroscillospira sp.]
MRELLKRYKAFFFLLMVNILLLAAEPELGGQSVKSSCKTFLEMLAILPPVFVIMGLMDVWIPKKTMMKYMGKDAGVKGGLIAFLLGSFSAGPLYASFPMAAVFMKKGVSLTNVYIFICAWSAAKIPMMMFEVTQLGAKFTMLRFCLNLVGIILIPFIIDRTSSEEEYREIQETACAQIENE